MVMIHHNGMFITGDSSSLVFDYSVHVFRCRNMELPCCSSLQTHIYVMLFVLLHYMLRGTLGNNTKIINMCWPIDVAFTVDWWLTLSITIFNKRLSPSDKCIQYLLLIYVFQELRMELGVCNILKQFNVVGRCHHVS